MAELSNKQKKEWAKLVYTKEGLNQKETAIKVGVSAKTMSKWVEESKWDTLKASFIISKEQELRRVYAQINELNTAIENKAEGTRYANSKEADTLSKLASTAKSLETEMSISSTIDTFVSFNNWLRLVDLVKAQLIMPFQDEYIKTMLK